MSEFLYDGLFWVVVASVPYWVAFLIGETRRRVRFGHWR
jgi:hypothetical protein